MGLSHSIAHQDKSVHSSPTSTAHFSDEDSIEYPQSLIHDSEKQMKYNNVLPWWKTLLSRLTPSRNRQTNHTKSTMKNPSCREIMYDSDADTAMSLTPPPQYFTDNEYFHAQTESIRVGLENRESHVLGANEWGNSISCLPEVNVLQHKQIEGGTLTKQSLSSARPCIQTEHKCMLASDGIIHPKPAAVSIAEAEVMYTKATWRMYERITSSRTTAVVSERFSIPNVVVLSDSDASYSPTEHINKWGDITSCDEIPQDDQITDLSSSVDRHHTCFDMDQD